MPAPVEFRSYTVDPVTPTEIRTPFACHTVEIEQTDTANDAFLTCGGIKRILAGQAIPLHHPARDSVGGHSKQGWAADQLVATVLSAGGTGPILVTFVGLPL